MPSDDKDAVIDSFDDFIDSLSGDELPAATKVTGYEKQRFTCEACEGTGLWKSGRANYRGNAKCNACTGRGYFVTSKAERQKAAVARTAAKARKADDVRAHNLELAGAELIQWLDDNSHWNSFANDLIGRHKSGKRAFSQPQVNAAQSMMEKTEATRAAKAAQKKAEAVEIDLQPIRDMFEAAVAKGLKRPTYRAEGLVINRAPDSGANPGALYVKTVEADYLGKLVGIEYRGNQIAVPPLKVIAENPLEAAVRYGRATGRCACCGRELSDPKSIALGIGPICADKWGF